MKLPRRLSIAGLMTIVLIFALGLVALRSESATWAGGVYLLTFAVLLLGIVGAVCRTGSERAWWLGFALFGIGYFRPAWFLGFRVLSLPTTAFLDLIKPEPAKPPGGLGGDPFGYYWLVGHCLWSFVAATIGGLLALALFAVPKAQAVQLDVEPRQEIRPARVKWLRAAAIGLAFLAPVSALILISPLSYPALWAGMVYLSTWVVLGMAVLGFACDRGKRRMIWLGAALFGLGYMFLNRSADGFEESSHVHLVADEFLNALRPMLPDVVSGFPAKTVAIARENVRIRKVLDQKIPMQFRDPTSLEDFLNYIRAKTWETDGREVPIYVDPVGLLDADKTMKDTIQIDLENCPLSTTLELALRQLSLVSYVRDGMVHITSTASDDKPFDLDYYLLVSHCVLALLSAGLGAFLVPLVSDREARTTA